MLSAGALPVQRRQRRRDPGLRRQRAGRRPVARQHTTFAVDKVLRAARTTSASSTSRTARGAQAKFDYERIGDVVPEDRVHAEYFANQDLAGAPALTRQDGAVDFDWGDGSPGRRDSHGSLLREMEQGGRVARRGVQIHGSLRRWSASLRRWKPRVEPLEQPGSDHLLGYPATRRGHSRDRAGVLRVGRRRDGTVLLGPSDEPPPPPVTPFTAEFFANRDLAGSPVVTRMDERIDFQWGGAAPDPALPNDSFSARWTRTTTYEAGRTGSR